MTLELAFERVTFIAGNIDLFGGIDMESAKQCQKFSEVVLTL